jgi:hypothetical protein
MQEQDSSNKFSIRRYFIPSEITSPLAPEIVCAALTALLLEHQSNLGLGRRLENAAC